jgi:hypothetical protein
MCERGCVYLVMERLVCGFHATSLAGGTEYNQGIDSTVLQITDKFPPIMEQYTGDVSVWRVANCYNASHGNGLIWHTVY